MRCFCPKEGLAPLAKVFGNFFFPKELLFPKERKKMGVFTGLSEGQVRLAGKKFWEEGGLGGGRGRLFIIFPFLQQASQPANCQLEDEEEEQEEFEDFDEDDFDDDFDDDFEDEFDEFDEELEEKFREEFEEEEELPEEEEPPPEELPEVEEEEFEEAEEDEFEDLDEDLDDLDEDF